MESSEIEPEGVVSPREICSAKVEQQKKLDEPFLRKAGKFGLGSDRKCFSKPNFRVSLPIGPGNPSASKESSIMTINFLPRFRSVF
jgi:hypothetical protein